MRHHGTLFCSIYFTLLFFCFLKLRYFEKATQILKISHFVLTLQSTTNFRTKWEIFSNFVAFSQYLNFYNFWFTMQFIARNFWLCQNWIEPKFAPMCFRARLFVVTYFDTFWFNWMNNWRETTNTLLLNCRGKLMRVASISVIECNLKKMQFMLNCKTNLY